MIPENLPHITLQWHLNQKNPQLSLQDGVFPDGNNIIVGAKNTQNIISKKNSERRTVIVIGSPIINSSVDRDQVADVLLTTDNVAETVSSLNGEFLLIIWDHASQALHIFNDRFSAYPFYWAQNAKEFVGGHLYLDVARHCRTWNGFDLRAEKAYEFFVLQRMMGTDTHDTLTHYLPAASCLSITSGNNAKITPYWTPSYHKQKATSRTTLGKDFVKLFSQSIHERLNDNADKKYGVFLSGGHDSRLVAAYSDRPVTCYTLGFSENQEVHCAKAIADDIGQDHVFHKLESDYFTTTLAQTSYMSGGMYALDHALFLPQENQTQSDIYLHGHGLDYMYQGMYLHRQHFKIAGRTTFIAKQLPLPKDVSEHFINNISFRLKFDYSDMFKSTYHDQLYQSVKAIEQKGCQKKLSKHQLWEYLIFHQPSRHYTFTNILSKRVCGETRTPTFDNAIYDFYHALPDKYRLNSDMLRLAMKAHPSNIANIPAGNHGAPAGRGPWLKTGVLIARKIMKTLTSSSRFAVPGGKERTWPDRVDYIKNHPEYWAAIKEPLADKGFKAFLDFMNWDKLENNPEAILDQAHGASLMVSLLTYYLFYKHLYR